MRDRSEGDLDQMSELDHQWVSTLQRDQLEGRPHHPVYHSRRRDLVIVECSIATSDDILQVIRDVVPQTSRVRDGVGRAQGDELDNLQAQHTARNHILLCLRSASLSASTPNDISQQPDPDRVEHRPSVDSVGFLDSETKRKDETRKKGRTRRMMLQNAQRVTAQENGRSEKVDGRSAQRQRER
jgi:hypothetical protein